MSTGIKVFAPASVANLACGYDILGLALEYPGDEIIFKRREKKGLIISQIKGYNNSKLPIDLKLNTAGVAAVQLLKHVGMEDVGIEMEIHKNMPSGSGLGSSAASAAAAVWGINHLLQLGLSKQELLPFAVIGEQAADGSFHADNVGPSLMGGILFIRNNESLDVHRLPCPEGLYLSVVLPEMTILTKYAREIISNEVPLNLFVQQTGNLGALIIGLYKSDFDLISRSLQDVVIEPQRALLIPHFEKVKESALKSGALGCSISGAGPSIFAMCPNSLVAEEVAIAMQNCFLSHKIQSKTIVSKINQEGAIIC